jgi:shikimate kinase
MNRHHVNTLPKNQEIGRKDLRVLEVVGPAGAGKSTLCLSLQDASESIRLSDFPDVRKIADAPFFVWYGLQLLPRVLYLANRESRQLTRREFAWLSILHGWPTVLQKGQKANKQVTILDQGPVYLMTELREFGPEYLRGRGAEKTWQSLYRKWGATLHAIVWLDAPDTFLVQRIRAREKEHLVKNGSVESAFEFLHRYRVAYERTLSTLAANSAALRVIRFDTNRETPPQIVNQVLTALDLSA